MSGLDLYNLAASPPCRLVQMVAKELKIDLNIINVDLIAGEQLKPEFLKLNPAHSVPVLVDHKCNGLVLADSHAIVTYLIDTRAPGHSLYPSDRVTRALIDRMLYFEAGTVFPTYRQAARAFIYTGADIDPELVKAYGAVMDILNRMLEGRKYLATDDAKTVADLANYATLCNADIIDFDFGPYPNVLAWMDRIKSELPYDQELNQKPVAEIKKAAQAKRAQRLQ